MKNFYRIKLKNGLTILFEKRANPVVSITALVKFGSSYEGQKNKGIAHFIEHMIFKGTKKNTARDISSSIEKVGGEINAFTAADSTNVYAKIPSSDFGLGMEIISDILFNSQFKNKHVERERKVIIDEIMIDIDSPQNYLSNRIQELLYNKPFAFPFSGTIHSVKNIKRKDLLHYYRAYNPSNIILSIVGNIKIEDVIDNMKKSFSLTAPRHYFKEKPIIKSYKKILESKSSLKEAYIGIGFHVPRLSTKQRYAAEILNCILGRGASSKLFQDIRERRGLAYGINSTLNQEQSYGYLSIIADTEKKNANKVKQLILKNIKDVRNIKIKEIREAKEELMGDNEISSEKSDFVAASLANNELCNDAKEFYEYPNRILSVKADEIRKLAKIKNYSSIMFLPK